jgi:hypothetical protein
LCTVCGRRGHTREQCFADSKTGDKGDGAQRCFRCDEEGHLIRDCPKKKKASVKFAAAVRARKSSSKRAVVSDADTERAQHAAVSHAVANTDKFACMARSFHAHADA